MKQQKTVSSYSGNAIQEGPDHTMGVKPPHMTEEQLGKILDEAEAETVENLDWEILKQPFKK